MFKKTGAMNAPALNCYEKCRWNANIFSGQSLEKIVELFRREKFVTVHVDQFKCTTATAGNAGQWIVGDMDMQTGFFRNQFIQIFQQGAAACKHDAADGNVCAQLGRCRRVWKHRSTEEK